MLFKGLFLAVLPATFAAPAPGTVQAPTSDGPAPPSGVTIEGISYAGSGCNAGSVAGAISNDLSTVTLLYDSFIAQAGSGIQPAEARKNCQLNLQLALPQGVIKSTHYFSGDSTQVSAQQTLKGDYDDNYLKTDEFGLESTVWSPCGEEGLLNVNSEVRVTPLNTNNTALLTVDSTDLKFTQIHYLQWQECDPHHG
ncbi:hypothetical protein SCAR479_12455 [Seiridium cardinale]|uniref:DUF4360 domain-containing protein n=1 Tax=Seiridium cardinale TaxID=138064 RepID=A0ABR2XAR2_9PEZI